MMPEVFNWVQVGTICWPVLNIINSAICKPFFSEFRCVFCISVLLKDDFLIAETDVVFTLIISLMSCEITQKILKINNLTVYHIQHFVLCTINSPHNLYRTTSDPKSYCYILRRSLYCMGSLSRPYSIKRFKRLIDYLIYLLILLIERNNTPIPHFFR